MVKAVKKLYKYIVGVSAMAFLILVSGCSFILDATEKILPKPDTALNSEQFDTQSNITLTPQPEKEVKRGFVFIYNDVEMAVDVSAEPILDALGEYRSCFEVDSCAIDGVIRTYSYGSFELDTYERDGKEFISCIYFKDDTVSTMEGVRLFMTEEQLFDIYGDEYSLESGMIVYSNEGMKLKFLISDKQIISIQYSSSVTEIKQ